MTAAVSWEDYGDFLPPQAIAHAQTLAGAVHDYDHEVVAHVLTTADLPSLAIALAAMIDLDRSPADLLAWNDDIPNMIDAGLRPHGTHAAFNRHKDRGDVPCPPCVHAERMYQRDRQRRRMLGRR